MVVHRLDQLLARTDPFDLAQALDRYVRAMSADRIQSVVIDARDRMGAYYRAEFVRLLAEYSGTRQIDANELSADRFAHIVRKAEGDDALRHAFARLLKSNLRAISVFGGTFTEGVLENVPSDRTVAIGEERPNLGMRAAVLGGVALALVLGGAVGEHVISNVRAQSVTSPLPPVAAPPVAAVMTAKPSAAPIAAATPGRASPTSTPQPSPTPAITASPQPVPAQTLAPAQAVAPPAAVPAQTTAPRVRSKHTPPPASGVATFMIPDPTPTPEPTPLDVTDMPDAYTDATPLPQETGAPAEVPHKVSLKTASPSPKPKSHSWFKRSILHLDPFKPGAPSATPTP